MGGRGSQRRERAIPVSPERRKETDRRQIDLDPQVSEGCNSGYRELKIYPNGNYKSYIADIDSSLLILGVEVHLASGHLVEFYENGNVMSCVLARPAIVSIFGVKTGIKNETPLLFYEDGHVKKFTITNCDHKIFFREKKWKYHGRAFAFGTTIEMSQTGDIISPAK